MIRRMSSMKPMSSIRSASSRTRTSTWPEVDASCCRHGRAAGRASRRRSRRRPAAPLLRRHGHAAIDHRRAQRQVAAVGLEARARPGRRARAWGDDEHADRVARGREARVGVRLEALEDGQRERGGLAGAGLGTAPCRSPPGEHERDRLLLDRGGVGVALFAHGTKDLRAQAQLVEGHLCVRVFVASHPAGPGPGLA